MAVRRRPPRWAATAARAAAKAKSRWLPLQMPPGQVPFRGHQWLPTHLVLPYPKSHAGDFRFMMDPCSYSRGTTRQYMYQKQWSVATFSRTGTTAREHPGGVIGKSYQPTAPHSNPHCPIPPAPFLASKRPHVWRASTGRRRSVSGADDAHVKGIVPSVTDVAVATGPVAIESRCRPHEGHRQEPLQRQAPIGGARPTVGDTAEVTAVPTTQIEKALTACL